jgi:histidinol dehydrogenase
MGPLKLRRISSASHDAAEQLLALRRRLSLQADVVSPRSRELTERVFGKPLTPGQVVQTICDDVRKRGLDAVLHYTKQLDNKTLDADSYRVTPEEMAAAHAKASAEFIETIRRIRNRVLSFQSGLIHNDAQLIVAGKYQLGMRYRPMKRVGICVPGGAAAYPSTLLMTVCPARAAGVKEIVVVMPPTANGGYNPDLLATCHELGVTEVYRIGGAQAVAAMAFGCDELLPVDMIVGPGNLFVTLAKKYVWGSVAIDCLAGPSEVVVIADDSAKPEHVAADLIAQAEHDPASSVLITWHEPLLDQVEREIDKQLARLSRGDLARHSLEEFGALVLADGPAQAVEWTNDIGPEHLHIATKAPERLLAKIDNVGAVFVGHFTPVALGDYAAGPSHVLPTGGTARFTNGLSAVDFLRRSSVLQFTAKGLAELAPDVRVLADKEGLTAHRASVDIRLQES